MNEQQVFEAVFKATGVSDFQKAISDAQGAVKKFEDGSKKLRDTGKTLTKGVTAPLVALGGVAMAVGSEYEASMSKVQAISGASADEMKAMEGVARDLGATTRFSASEAADGMSFLAMAGFDTSQVLDAIPDMLDLAAASGMGLADTADIATNILTGFAMEAGEAGRVADVLAAASSSANTDVAQLGEAMAYVAPVAQGAGISMEEASAAVGMLSDAGIQGGRAGTTLRNVISRLQNPTGDAVTVMEELGLTMEDLDPTTQTLAEVMETLEASGMDSADAMRFFGQEAGPGMTAMLEQGSDKLADFTASLNESEGAAGEMAAIMDDNVLGALLGLKSAAEDVAISFFEMAEGPMRAIIDAVTEAVRWFGGLDPVIQQVIGILGLLAAAIGPLLMLIGQIGLGVSALGTFFVGTAGSVSVFATIIGALTNPVTLVIAAIAALAGVIVYLYQTNEEFRNKVQEIWTNIQMIFEEVTMIISEILTMAFETLSAWWAENQQGFMDIVNSVWTAISEFFIVIFTAIGDIINAIWQPISDWYQENNKLIGETISVVWNAIAGVFMAVMAIIGGSVTAGFNIVSSVIEAVMPYVKTIIDSVMYAIMNVISLVMGIISGDWGAVWNSIKNIAQSVWNVIKALVEGAIEGVKAIISSVLDAIFGDWSVKWNQIKNKVSEIWEGIKSAVSTKINDVKTSISEGIQGALDTVTGFFGKFKEAGSNIVSNIADGIRGAVGKVTSAIGSITQKIADFLPNSPPKDKSSPLMNLHKHAIGEEIARGIYDGEGEIQSAINRALDVDMPMMSGRVNHSVNMNNGRTENLLEQLVNSNQVIVLDSGELVGATYSQYDRVGGNQTQLTERWGR